MNCSDLFIDNDLLEPLSKKELYEYFIKYKEGDMDARDMIIRCNIKLVLNRVLKRFNNTDYDKNELVSVGLIGLIKSVDTFDISKNYYFSTYAVRCIDNEILLFMRNNKKYNDNISIDDTINNCFDDKDNIIIDYIRDESIDFVNDYENKEINLIIRDIINELSDRDKEIIYMYFGFIDDKLVSQNEIANMLNISQSLVSKIIKRILKDISIRLYKEEIIDTKKKIKKR